MPPMPVPSTQPIAPRVVGQLALPAGVGERLGAGGERELGEAVGAARLLDREEVAGVELDAARLAVADAAHARRSSARTARARRRPAA